MSSSLNELPSNGNEEKVDMYGRKIWDVEYYAQRAAEKLAEGDVDDGVLTEVRKEKVYPPAHLRKPLQQRIEVLELDKELGKQKVITANTPKMLQGGYWCNTCECLIKDSQAYLDHINGKKHNRLLGMNMRVEAVSTETVQNKLKMLHKQKLSKPRGDDEMDIQMRLKALKEKEDERKQRRREKKRRKAGGEGGVRESGEGIKIEYDEEGMNRKKMKNEEDATNDEEMKMRIAMGFPIGFSGQ